MYDLCIVIYGLPVFDVWQYFIWLVKCLFAQFAFSEQLLEQLWTPVFTPIGQIAFRRIARPYEIVEKRIAHAILLLQFE